MSRKNTGSDGYTTGCGMHCINRSELPSHVGMNPQQFPEADHLHRCVTDGLITVPDEHQLNGEVEIPIVLTTNTMADTQKESTPLPEEVAFGESRYQTFRQNTPRKFKDKYVGNFVPEWGALIHEKNSDPTQFIDFKDI
ncbi:hypothetical protein Tco_1030413, partial [Tanacetum coccineum]